MTAAEAEHVPVIGVVQRAVVVPTRAARLASRVVQLGAVGVVLVASTYRMFDLDRFFVPKELVLHASAVIAGLLLIGAFRRAGTTRVDLLLALFLGWSAVSVLFATNRWVGLRALAVSVSGVVLFFVARALRDAGLGERVLNALAIAVVLCAITSLLQAYGVRLDVFAMNRAPGGTLGNRNFVAHAAAFGFPLLLVAAMRAKRGARIGVLLVTAALVLTRSRAAWLAFAVMAVTVLLALVIAPALRRSGRVWRRFATLLLFIAAGVAAALLLPNALRWRSDNPYVESMKDVANYQEGSGRGRMIQYQRSLVMAAHAPLFGLGPGNWPVRYAEYAARRDPSMDPMQYGMTANPWPSSDWVSFAAERGFPALIVMIVVFLTFARGALQQLLGALDVDDALRAVALLGTIIAAGVVGLFDAVLLLALPTFLVWTTLGVLWAPVPEPRRLPAQSLVFALLVLCSGVGAARSAAQMTAMDIFATNSDRDSLEQASRIDPGNFRLHVRLARLTKGELRRQHLRAARELFPNAER